MAAFTIEMGSPVRSGWIGGLGGPNSGGHKGPHWYIQYGNDLHVTPGTEVCAPFSGRVTRYAAHVKATDTAKVYGAQLFMRADNDMMGGFFTHITGCPALAVGQTITRGDRLGLTLGSHLHFALIEIIGGAPGGVYKGVDLYQHFMALRDQTNTVFVTFKQNHSAPSVGSEAPPAKAANWVSGWWKVSDGNTYYYFFSEDGVVKYTKAKPSNTAAPPARADNTGTFTSVAPNQLVVTWKQVPGAELACQETFNNAVPGSQQMNASSNLYRPLAATRQLN